MHVFTFASGAAASAGADCLLLRLDAFPQARSIQIFIVPRTFACTVTRGADMYRGMCPYIHFAERVDVLPTAPAKLFDDICPVRVRSLTSARGSRFLQSIPI